MATSSVVDVDLPELLTAVEEIKLLRIKYERLIQISRALLKPWTPPETTTDKQLSTSSDTADKHSVQLATPPQLHPSPELEYIDKALTVAHQIRITQHQQTKISSQKATPSFKKSIQQAKSVYAAPKISSDLKIKKTAGQQNVKKPLATTTVAMDTSKHIHCESLSKKEEPTVSLSIPPSFSLQLEGTTLTLPSKYLRMKKIINKYKDHFEVNDKSSESPCDVFLRTVSSENDVIFIKLHLIREELMLLKETFSSLSSQELFADCQSLKELIQSKLKLELLYKSAKKLCSLQCNDDDLHASITSSCSDNMTLLESIDNIELKLEYIKTTIDNYFLSYCQRRVLPWLQSLDPSDRQYPVVVQCLQNIIGLKRTIFVTFENTTK